jgi:hypothetical protein
MADKVRSGSSTSASFSLLGELSSSMTEAILERLDATALPLRVHETMEQVGWYLQAGYGHLEIGRLLDPPRSEDWVATRVREARAAIAAQVLENAGDEMSADLRARLEAFAPPDCR